MKNYIQDGDNLDLVAPRNLTSGDGFIVGSIFAVASTTVSSGDSVVGCTDGVYAITKKSATVFAVGDKVSWDNTNHYCDAPGTGLFPIGLCTVAAGNGATTVAVKLNETATAAA